MDPDAVAQHVRTDLERLVAIPSVAFPGFPEEPVRAAAALTAEILSDAGLQGVELLEVEGGPPAVFGCTPGPPGAPTVLLYAHYDVQPAGPEEEWTSSPWALTERDGRLFARGAADDKYAIAMHAGVLRAFDGAPPVTVKVVVEGDEETGRGTFDGVVAADPERFAADLVVVADSGNPVVGEPALTTSLRAMAVLDVTVRTLAGPVHSGLFGGAAPDALLALSRMIASLHDDAGDVAVEGLAPEAWTGRAVEEGGFRASAGVRDGVGLVGTGPLAERLYARPAISAIGLDVPSVDTAGNAVLPHARARISARLPPLADAEAATEAIAAHLRAAAPWGVDVEIAPKLGARGFRLTEGGPGDRAARTALETAYGRETLAVGSGGAIPLVAALADAIPQAEIVLWGAADEACRMHAADESVDAGELERATRAEVELLRRFAATAG